MLKNNKRGLGVSQSDKFDYINDLLSQFSTYKDYPIIKANETYYIDYPDEMIRISVKMPTDGTQLVGREYHYKELHWNNRGFSLRDTSYIKICHVQNTGGGHS